MSADPMIDRIAQGIYEAMYEGYTKPDWGNVSPMDQFRCERAARSVISIPVDIRKEARPYPISERPPFRERVKERMGA